ncbi:MAG: hypothetical protein F8N37_23470 [Telmatospirillum sp.]|nr:hypothetical protein [Telmatospirillum sp.]
MTGPIPMRSKKLSSGRFARRFVAAAGAALVLAHLAACLPASGPAPGPAAATRAAPSGSGTADPTASTAPETRLPAPEDGVNHGPGLIALPDGRLLACWYSGSAEADADVRILCSDSADGGDQWSPSVVAVGPGGQAAGAASPNKSVGNATLLLDGRGTLWLIYGVIRRWDWPVIGTLCRNWRCGRVDARPSPDLGRHWGPAVRLDDDTGALPRGRPLHLPAIGDVLPLYHEGGEDSYLRILDMAAVPAAGASSAFPPPSRTVPVPGGGIIEPAALPLADGRILLMFRDNRRIAVRMAIADPARGAVSPAVPTDLANPGSPVELFADRQGRIVVVHNPGTGGRDALALAWTRDGVHVRPGCVLVPAGTEGDVAYPAIARTDDGIWHVVYSSDGKRRIRHRRFDDAWLDRCLASGEAVPHDGVPVQTILDKRAGSLPLPNAQFFN